MKAFIPGSEISWLGDLIDVYAKMMKKDSEGLKIGRRLIVMSGERKRFIKEDRIPIEISKMIGSAFTIRNASDYDDMFIASKDETAEQLSNAEYVYGTIKKYIESQNCEIEEGVKEEKNL